MMLDIARTIVASLTIAAAVPPLSAYRALQKPSSAEMLSAAADRGIELLAVLRDYSYYAELTIQTVSQSDTITGKYYHWFPAYTTADDRIRVGRYFTRAVVNVRFTGYKKVTVKR